MPRPESEAVLPPLSTDNTTAQLPPDPNDLLSPAEHQELTQDLAKLAELRRNAQSLTMRGPRGLDTAPAVKVAQIPTAEAGTTYCPRCSARWGGLKTSHCTACHETFTTVTSFDKHRTGSHPVDTRSCLDPASVGLVSAGRAYPCWGFVGRSEETDGEETGA
jgi:hypothetical protein